MSDKPREAARNGIEAGADKAKGAVEWAGDKVDAAKEGALGLVDVVQQRARNVTQVVSDAAGKVRDKGGDWIEDAADSVQSTLSSGYDETHHAIEHFGRDVTAVIRKHPMTAVAIGLGLGLLLGRVAGGRS